MNLPVPRATLEEMERNRARAIDLYGAAFDALAEARRFGALAACSASNELCLDDESRDALAPKYISHRKGDLRGDFISAMTKQTDKAMWAHIIQATDLERLMDHQARNELRNSLHDKPPPATVDNVRATLGQFLDQSKTIFQRGIVNAFCGLDRRFRSHDGFKVGSRVILDRAFDTQFGGWNYHNRKDEILRDIERTFHTLDEKPHPVWSAGICGKISDARGLSWEVEGDYFRVRRFKNGNAHLWFTRDDLLRKVNRLLADYYGEAIGESPDVADTASMGPSYHVTPAKDFGLFESPAAVVQAVFEQLGDIKGKQVLEPSAGRGRLADEARRRGGIVQCVEIQPELYRTLRSKGLSVREGDFLRLTTADLGTFDTIVMNPPFDRGRDCDHVRHALGFLKPGGVLVSVMSASAQVAETSRAISFRALIDKICPPGKYFDKRWEDLPAGSFKESGTMVNTCILRIVKAA